MSVPNLLREGLQQAALSAFGENKCVVLFGTADSADAALQIDRFLERTFKVRIREVLFVRLASALAAGLVLSDGRKVFLKIHAGELSLDELQALHHLQEGMRGKGIPAARLILPAEDFGNGKFASVHAFRDRGDRLRAYHRGAIEAAAAGFARLIVAGRAPSSPAVPDIFTKRQHPFVVRASGTAPPKPLPPSERAGELITAARDRARSAAGSEAVGHSDWSSGNLRFAKDELASIFDFEALKRGPEPLLVGQAAIQFINEPSGISDPPSAAAHFIKSYEKAAGREFTGEEAVAVETGAALAAAIFFRAVVRSDGMKDQDVTRIFSDFIKRFRVAYGRSYPETVWTD
jgi:hypothetical protein